MMLPTRPNRLARRPARQPARRGLSLIEVLLSLAILVLALAAVGKLVDIGTDRGNDSRATTRGTRLAQSKMSEVEAGLVGLTSETDGQFTGDDGGWSFSVIPQPAGPPNLYTVTVRVSRDLQGRPFEVVLTQIMFDPTMMGTAAQAEVTAPTTGTTTGSGTGTGTGTGTGGSSP
jgi:prepilin-type N-terminal cleavage/methylation domain-containing protein